MDQPELQTGQLGRPFATNSAAFEAQLWLFSKEALKKVCFKDVPNSPPVSLQVHGSHLFHAENKFHWSHSQRYQESLSVLSLLRKANNFFQDFLRTDAAPQNNRRPVFFDILQLQFTILVRRQMQHLVHALNLHHGISCRPMSNLAVTGVTGFVKL